MGIIGRFARRRRPGARSASPRFIRHSSQPSQNATSPSKLQSLFNMGHILYDPIRIPRYPIVLCHGLYGFAVRGPTSFPRFQIHYWGKLLEILRSRLGVKVIIGKVPPTGTIEERAIQLNQLLQAESKSSHHRHPQFNFIAHSMGGLDARYLITHINPQTYSPISLTTICTPHRGSPFMDWCRANIGVGLTSENNQKPIPFSLKEPLLRPTPEQLGYLPNNLLKVLLLNILDSPAYSNLSTDYLENQFNPSTPDQPNVKYFSIAAKTSKSGLSVIHPLWLPGLLMDKLGGLEQGGHDGLVTVNSARWGDFLGVVENTDHWEIRGSSAFGSSLNEPDGLINQQAKSNWLELNRYIGSWISSDTPSKSKKSSQEYPNLSNSKHEAPSSNHQHQIQDEQSLSTRALADWIVKKLPLNLYHSSQNSTNNNNNNNSKTQGQIMNLNLKKNCYRSTINPAFPLDDLDYNQDQFHQQKTEKFDLEKLYLAVCRNLHDHGL